MSFFYHVVFFITAFFHYRMETSMSPKYSKIQYSMNPKYSYCDFLQHVCTTSCRVCRGKLCHFFTKARCECLLPLPHGPPNPCQILQKLVPNWRGGTPWRALSAPKRPKGTQERSKRPPETAKKRLQERLGALLRRFGRVLSAIWASRRSL